MKRLKRLAGVLTMIATLAAALGLASGANAELIQADIDGDRVKDPVAATVAEPGTLTVTSLLSRRDDAFTYLNFTAPNSGEPFIEAKGNVNRSRGAELFVRTVKVPAFKVISVLTVKGGKLTNARSFFVDKSLSDGAAYGFECGTVKGRPGIRSFRFKLKSNGSWVRHTNRFAWRKGKLVQAGKTRRQKVKLPPPNQRTVGCPKPVPPPKPPPVLGSSGNRYLKGLGTVKPKSFTARAGSGRYFGFKWKGWDRPRATARGFFNAGGPGDRRKRMSLTAFDLGKCGGRETYRKLTMKPAGQRGITLGVC